MVGLAGGEVASAVERPFGHGSYPILGNPHYHQAHDVLETISQPLVAEVSKTTLATLMLLASAPSRVANLKVERAGAAAAIRAVVVAVSTATNHTCRRQTSHTIARVALNITAPITL